jgi:hypothetical protein
MKKSKSVSEKKKIGGSYAGKCNGCGSVLTGNRVGGMCDKCYNRMISAPNK